MRGTKTYFSPEILNHDQQDDKVDVWCVGVIIYELVCFQSPFQGSSEKEILENIRVTMRVILEVPISNPIENKTLKIAAGSAIKDIHLASVPYFNKRR